VPHDEKEFFESFYRASVRGEPEDRMTIGPISDPEARFHYNAVENAIIRALLRRSPPPAPAMVEAWRTLQKRAGLRLLDVGSGTGHWIDFFRDVFHVAEAIGIEIAADMAEHLRRKYAGIDAVTILTADVADPGFDSERIGGPVDYVTAIGVMFHITDDARWRRALANLRDLLKPGGLLLVGGDFGSRTENVQFHRSDRFSSWREFHAAVGTEGEVRVSRRLRSLTLWSEVAAELELRIVDVVRADREPLISTPENDLLVLARPD
jgi:SAM-dependent methyltransferase